MCNATDDPARERQHLDQLLGKRIDGLVVTARRADKRAADRPVRPRPAGRLRLLPGRRPRRALPPPRRRGRRAARRRATSPPSAAGASPTSPAPSTSRRSACAATATRAASPPPGLPELAGSYLTGPWSEAWGREAVARLFDRRPHAPDALFCGNDQIARGAADALRERGLAVPGDVAIVGFDNWDVMVRGRPPAALQRRHEPAAPSAARRASGCSR